MKGGVSIATTIMYCYTAGSHNAIKHSLVPAILRYIIIVGQGPRKMSFRRVSFVCFIGDCKAPWHGIFIKLAHLTSVHVGKKLYSAWAMVVEVLMATVSNIEDRLTCTGVYTLGSSFHSSGFL